MQGGTGTSVSRILSKWINNYTNHSGWEVDYGEGQYQVLIDLILSFFVFWDK